MILRCFAGSSPDKKKGLNPFKLAGRNQWSFSSGETMTRCVCTVRALASPYPEDSLSCKHARTKDEWLIAMTHPV